MFYNCMQKWICISYSTNKIFIPTKNIYYFFQETFPHQGHSPEPGGPEAALRVRDEPRPDDLHSRPAQAHPPRALLPLDWSGVCIPHLDLRLPLGKHWCEKYLL